MSDFLDEVIDEIVHEGALHVDDAIPIVGRKEGIRQLLQPLANENRSLREEVAALKERLSAAVAGLEKYGVHLTECELSFQPLEVIGRAEPKPCTCGYDEALQAAKGE